MLLVRNNIWRELVVYLNGLLNENDWFDLFIFEIDLD